MGTGISLRWVPSRGQEFVQHFENDDDHNTLVNKQWGPKQTNSFTRLVVKMFWAVQNNYMKLRNDSSMITIWALFSNICINKLEYNSTLLTTKSPPPPNKKKQQQKNKKQKYKNTKNPKYNDFQCQDNCRNIKLNTF